MPKLHLIDASIYIFRAWFSLSPEIVDAQGNPSNALQGFAEFLSRFLMQVRPTHVAVAFDESLTTSFRNEIYPAYKANRELPPADLELQLGRCRELIERCGLPAFASPTLEADDLIGCLTTIGREAGFDNIILTGDKDLAQLLEGSDILWDFAKNKRHRVDDIPDWLGVHPHQVADRLAITGDSVDNIPGVPGIGPKGATALLKHFGSLDAIYERIDEVLNLKVRGAARLQRLLQEHEDKARLARQLTGIVTDADLYMDIDKLTPIGADLDALEDWSMNVGIGSAARNRLLRVLGEMAL